jgi:ubiquinone/menaquinone biosynthesis C-methylase UbiE
MQLRCALYDKKFSQKEHFKMKRNLSKLLLISLFGVASLLTISSCQSQNDPDAWEQRHNGYQPPEQVMDSIGVKPGMVIAEIGAGRGRYVVHMAKRVGATGKIYANDIDKKALDYLEYRCQRESIPNVITVLGKVTDPQLPRETIDLVYMINTYHHLDKPVELMKNMIPCFKPDGRLVIIEHDPVKVPDFGSEATAKDVLIEQAKQAGFELVRMMTFLKRDNIYVLRMKN